MDARTGPDFFFKINYPDKDRTGEPWWIVSVLNQPGLHISRFCKNNLYRYMVFGSVKCNTAKCVEIGLKKSETYFWINTLQGHLLVDRLLWSWDTISVSLSVLVVIGVILWFCHDVICDRFNELKIEILYEVFPKRQNCEVRSLTQNRKKVRTVKRPKNL